jgi:L-threonylcarbamoyladenylate synthase
VAVLLAGGVVVYPSDTVYGLLCRADNHETVERVRRMKGSPPSRPFILLVDGLDMARRLADVSDPEISAILTLRWPGRLTMVLPAVEGCPPWVAGEDGTVALRYPADPLSLQLLRGLRQPLVSTSANLAGGDPSLSLDSVPRRLLEKADLILDAGILPPSSPSTVIRLLRGRT